VSIDLPFHRPWLEEDEINEVVDTLKSGWLTTGPKTQHFENDFKEYVGARHAIGLNSCTAGLKLAVISAGFKDGDEVITTPMTFPATSNVLVLERLRPVFVDIEPETLNLDVKKIESKITTRTRGILPVHFAGHPCDMDVIQDIARRKGLAVIEDGAHAMDARYKGVPIGGLGNPTAFSFYANKNITTGEGGMLTLDDDARAELLRAMRLHGLSRDAWKRFGNSGFAHWVLQEPGFKYNMSDINASLGIHQLKKAPRFLKLRQEYAEIYDQAFRDEPAIEIFQTRDYALHARHLYLIALKLEQLTITRDEFLNLIQATGIGVAVHYIALHLQPFYQKEFGYKAEDFPIATRYSNRVVSLPLYPKMTHEDVARVIDTTLGLIKKYRK